MRTCTIHHIDLPWTSSDLEQRNGRGRSPGQHPRHRQHFLLLRRPLDRWLSIQPHDGKAGWLADLLKSDKRDTNNPAAQQQLTPEDILVMISRNKEKTLAIIEAKKAKAIEEARLRRMAEATRLLRQANARFRDARNTTNVELARRLREEGESRLAELGLADPAAWPWGLWMYAVRDTEYIVPEDGSAPLYEGLRVTWPRAGNAELFDHLEFGRTRRGGRGLHRPARPRLGRLGDGAGHGAAAARELSPHPPLFQTNPPSPQPRNESAQRHPQPCQVFPAPFQPWGYPPKKIPPRR